MGQWFADLSLGHIKLLSTELFWKKKIHFLHNFLQFPFKNFSKYYFFILFFIFCNLKEIKSNSLVTVLYALRLSQQPTVSLNYSQSIKVNMAPSDSRTIISSFNRPIVIYLRLTNFKWSQKCCKFSAFSLKFQKVFLITRTIFSHSRSEQFW